MKSVIDSKPGVYMPFPKLMRHRDGRVVLFHEARRGMVVHVPNGARDEVGVYSPDWGTWDFEDCPDSVTLSNS